MCIKCLLTPFLICYDIRIQCNQTWNCINNEMSVPRTEEDGVLKHSHVQDLRKGSQGVQILVLIDLVLMKVQNSQICHLGKGVFGWQRLYLTI